MYGACAKIPDGYTKTILMNAVLDGFIDVWWFVKIKFTKLLIDNILD